MQLGIPKKIGPEFVPEEATAGHAAGTLFVAPDGHVLLLCRAHDGGNYEGHWCLPGGKGDEGESPEETADRESREETGGMAPSGKKRLLDSRVTPNKMAFHTYAQPVTEKFVPKLDGEHTGYAWAPIHMLPSPIHPSVALTVKERLAHGAEAMDAEAGKACGTGLAKWAAGDDCAQDAMALDRDSVRRFDKDGRLHVAITNISKANVCEYWGREIPDFASLGLDPEKKYKLYRDPYELQKAAQTFNNLPLLAEHVAITADDHRPELVIGSTGTDATFDTPFLRNSLVIWARNGIEHVESEAKKELSSAYRYRADMTPGRTREGEDYDGIMRDIVGNHVALVKEGRAGPDVVVGDSKEELIMAKAIVLSRKGAMLLGVATAAMLPKLAADSAAKFNAYSLAPAFDGVTTGTFKEKRPGMVASLTKIATPLLAKDESLEGVIALLDKLEGVATAEGVDSNGAAVTEPNAGGPLMKPKGLDSAKEFLKGKLNGDDYANFEAMMSGEGQDEEPEETEEEKKAREAAEAAKKAEDEKDEEDKKKDEAKAMDAQIKTAVSTAVAAATAAERKRFEGARAAERKVRPWVGELAVACDSAEGVFRAALTNLGVSNVDKIHESGLEAVLDAQPKPGERRASPVVAHDAAAAKSYAERFAGADKIQVAG